MASGLPKRRKTSGRAVRHPDLRILLELDEHAAPPRPIFSIDIDRVNGRFRATLRDGQGSKEQCTSKLSAHDLSRQYALLSSKAHDALSGLGSLPEVADIGYRLFCELFTRDTMRERIRTLLGGQDGSRPCFAVVHAEDFALPWSLLYLQKPESEPIDISWFLGQRCVVVSDVENPEVPPMPIPPEISPPVEVLGAYCDLLPYSRDEEIPFVRRHTTCRRFRNKARFVDFPELQAQGTEKSSIEMNQLARKTLFEGQADLVHFACHGSNGREDGDNYLRVRRDYHLSHTGLYHEHERFRRHPFVFLNACDMGIVEPLNFVSVVGFFLGKGARAVLAPACEVGDKSAARFARSFYKHLIIGRRSLMEALFLARREVHLRHKDLIGLAYVMYGRQGHARLAAEGAHG